MMIKASLEVQIGTGNTESLQQDDMVHISRRYQLNIKSKNKQNVFQLFSEVAYV